MMINKNIYMGLNKEELNGKFIQACQNGHLELVKYLLTSPDLKEHANINYKDDNGFKWACRNEHFDIVKYLTSSPDLKDKIDIHLKNDLVFVNACANGQINVIKFLLTSPELSEHSNLSHEGFVLAYKQEELEVIRFLIFDMNIEKNNKVKKLLRITPNEQIENMFKMRELNKYLEKELNSDNNNQKNKKVKL